MKRTLALCLLVAGLALSEANAVQAKGEFHLETFRISGGDLTHAVTVTLIEYNIAVSGEGSWYTGASVDAPPATATRYRIDVVDAKDGSTFDLPPQEYVPGPAARISGADGVGWAEPIQPIRDLLDRYIYLGVRQGLSEHATFADVLQASRASLGVAVIADGNADQLASKEGTFLSLLGQSVPVVFGVRGTLIGRRNLHGVHLDVTFGTGKLSVVYVPPGAVARFGLFLNPTSLGNWGYISLLSPPGYTTNAYSVPPEMDQLMADAGFRGADEGEIVDSHIVPLDKAQLSYGDDHIEVWRGNAAHLRLAIPTGADDPSACTPDTCPAMSPIPPFAGVPMHVEIWPMGVDPFPEAVRPNELTYYPEDATRNGRGVLVEMGGRAQASSFSGSLQPPYYADQALDQLLRDASLRLDQPRIGHGSTVRAFAVGTPAVLAGVLALVWTSVQAERRRGRGG